MKKIIFLLFAVVVHLSAFCQREDMSLRAQISDLEIRVSMLEEQLYNDTVMIEQMSRLIDEQQIVIDSLCQCLQIDQKNLTKTKSDLKSSIDGNHEQMITKYDYLDAQINKKTLLAGLVGVGAILVSIILYFVIRRKNKKQKDD